MPTADHTLILTVAPCRPRSRADRNWPGRFDVRLGGRLMAFRTRTPFCDGARALLAEGLAKPGDQLIMRYAGSDADALRGTVGVVASLTVSEAGGPPRFVRWQPRPDFPATGLDAMPEDKGEALG